VQRHARDPSQQEQAEDRRDSGQQEIGRGILGDVLLLMFDDVLLADIVDPPVTVVAQPTAEFAGVGATLLVKRWPRLIVRGSV